MRCYFAECDHPAAYVQLKATFSQSVADSWVGIGPKDRVESFQTCKAHGLIMHWDDPKTRALHGVLTAEEFEVYRVHEE